jgi:epoxyqueuosine reductase
VRILDGIIQASDSATTTMVPFSAISVACAAEGLVALATMAVPAALDPAGYERLLADGVGDMDWLRHFPEKRLNPGFLKPGATSLLVVALDYQPTPADGALRRARYAAGKDYHNILRPKLGRVGRALEILAGPGASVDDHRATVDSAPLNERTLAAMAGLGWIGRNALVISPDAGSYRVLGCLLTTWELESRRGPHGEDRCGKCTACESRCPTAALKDRRVISERCISYLTIEHKGVVPRHLADRFQGWWFGCDLCQEACPWNRFAPPAGDPRLTGTEADAALLAVNAATFDSHFAGRSIRRIGYERFRRNLLIALHSLGRGGEAGAIIAEGLPLVIRQARELGMSLDGPATPTAVTP